MKSKESFPEQRSLFDDPASLEPSKASTETAATVSLPEAADVAAASVGRYSLFVEDEPFVTPPVPAAPPKAVTPESPAVAAREATQLNSINPSQPVVAVVPSRENEWAGIASLDEIKPKILSCTACNLREGAHGVVFGEGDPHARIMFVGEGPGQTEDETGRPFVGRAGQLLDAMLRTVGFQRSQVFIANIVKCRPPGNRLPIPPEVEVCIPHLRAQIRIVSPDIIVLLGALSSQTLIDPSIRVTRDRGKWFQKDGRNYLVTFHPAAVLRDEPGKRPLITEDFRSLRAKWERLGK